MGKYILRRLVLGVPTLLLVSVVVFIMLRVMPGNVAYAVLGLDEGASGLRASDVEKINQQLGLDRPLVIQYLSWIGQLARFDLGTTLWGGQEIKDILMRRGPVSAQLAIIAMVFAWLCGVPVGVYSALKQNKMGDYIARVTSVLGLAVPNFWLGLLVLLAMIMLFSWSPPLRYTHIWDNPVTNVQQTLPAGLVLGLSLGAYLARMTRSSVLETMREDYVRTAYAKGLALQPVVLRHVLRNALIPVVTLSGVMFGFLLGGSVVIESVFSLPGLGEAFASALGTRDYALVQTLVTMYAVLFLLVNLATDLLYGVIDPRVRNQMG